MRDRTGLPLIPDGPCFCAAVKAPPRLCRDQLNALGFAAQTDLSVMIAAEGNQCLAPRGGLGGALWPSVG